MFFFNAFFLFSQVVVMKEKSVKCNGKKRREGWEIVTFCVTSNEKFNIKKNRKNEEEDGSNFHLLIGL